MDLWIDLSPWADMDLGPPMSLRRLRKTQWSSKFEYHQRNRFLVGTYRYGGLQNLDTSVDLKDLLTHCVCLLDDYWKTGNQEYLVDIANWCMIEFVQQNHPNAHFRSIDDGRHAKRK